MANNQGKIDSVDDFTGKGLRELEVWLERFLKGSLKGETGGPGALEWEDVGASGGVASPAWVRHAVFHSSAVVSAGGGSIAFGWDAELSGYDPGGEVADRDATLTHVIRLLSSGAFIFQASLYVAADAGAKTPLVFSLSPSAGQIGMGELALPYSPDYQAASGTFLAPVRVTAPPTTYSLYARDVTWPAAVSYINVALVVSKLSP